MLAIRLQRVGRSGHAQFRIVVQDSRFSAKSGRVVAYLGSYNPHTKAAELDKDKANSYLSNGAQPSDRVAMLLQKQGIKLPAWVKVTEPKKRQIRHPDKLRRNRPPEAKEPAPAAEEALTEETSAAEAAEPAPENVEATPEATEETPEAEKPEAAADEAAPAEAEPTEPSSDEAAGEEAQPEKTPPPESSADETPAESPEAQPEAEEPSTDTKDTEEPPKTSTEEKTEEKTS